jgi:hypothetical protein
MTCDHDWRRGPDEPLRRYHAKVCIRCNAYSIGRDWDMPELNEDEKVALTALLPPPQPAPRVPLRRRVRWHVQRARTRLASIIAGYDWDYR